MKPLMAGAALVACMAVTPVFAAGDLSRADVQEVALTMGTNDDGSMYFQPDDLVFETGKAYKLKMINVDTIKHEVTFGEAGEKLFTRKVEIETPDGELVAEIKGVVHEVEVGPNRTVDWYFVPVQTIEGTEITCELEGHREAGMFGTVAFQ